MTFLEKLKEDNTNKDETWYRTQVNEFCPHEFGYGKDEHNTCDYSKTFNPELCVKCWNREMPDTNKSVLLTMDKDKEHNIDKKIKEQEECSYNKGLEVAWELAKKIWSGKDSENVEIFGTKFVYEIYQLSPQEVIAKLKEYEDAKIIEIGDVVENDKEELKGLVLDFTDNDTCVWVLDEIRCVGKWNICDLKKTSRKVDIKSLLQQIGE